MAGAKSSIPDNILQLLNAADARQGFPAGTMASVMQQEIGGQFDKFLADPTAYHYAAGTDGRRVAPHTGKVSTAFGPFGILESTAADPGFGVKPLGSKDLNEQIRFASDYLAARSRSSGGLEKGLAGYGEGAKYAQQVTARAGGKPADAAVPVDTRSVEPAPEVVATAGPEITSLPLQSTSPSLQSSDAWAEFNQALAANKAPVTAEALSTYGAAPKMAQFDFPMAQANRKIDFSAFQGWGARV